MYKLILFTSIVFANPITLGGNSNMVGSRLGMFESTTKLACGIYFGSDNWLNEGAKFLKFRMCDPITWSN